ncbi:MAG: S9 family peptidase [Candidatus Marinimicrobia bacterium]|nr:S9 family peptidase [Candidatus Neomarinimicrobiota bacterium]
MKPKRSILLIAGFVVLICNITIADEKRPMNLIDFLNVPSVSSPQISPDGKYAAFIKEVSDWGENKRVGHIWLVNVSTGRLTQLTNGSGEERNPEWSPDGRTLAFIDKRANDETPQIYLINIAHGEAKRLTNHPTSVSNIQWSPDRKKIYFLAADEPTPEEKKKKELKDDVYAFEANYHNKHLWYVEVETGKETRVTTGDYTVYNYVLSQDGKKIAFIKSSSPMQEDLDHSEIWIMNSDGGEQKRLTFNNIPERRIEISPDNKNVLFITWTNENFELYYDNNLFIIDTRTRKTQMLLKDFKYGIERAVWSKSGEKIYFIANMGVHTELFSLDLKTGRTKQYTSGKHDLKYWNWDFNPQKEIHLFSVTQPHNPGDLWILKISKKASLKRITHIFDYLEEQFLLPKQEAIRWKGKDGVIVEGIFCYPVNYERGKRYPLIVIPHGGPRWSSRYLFGNWVAYIPVMAGRGYAVLLPNYRGSTGYGDNFVRDMVGHYFNQAHNDIIAGIDSLIDAGIVDSTKLIIGGWSAGGHMTNKLITYTNRFRAASSGAGASNWISMYAQSDTRVQRTPWFGGTPWEKDAPIDTYWEHSPLKYIWRAKTPTIIFVGEEDPRVPMPQSVELYRALKYNGVPVKLYIAPREGHGWQELRHRLFKMNAELEWFEKWVMNREYKWETVD